MKPDAATLNYHSSPEAPERGAQVPPPELTSLFDSLLQAEETTPQGLPVDADGMPHGESSSSSRPPADGRAQVARDATDMAPTERSEHASCSADDQPAEEPDWAEVNGTLRDDANLPPAVASLSKPTQQPEPNLPRPTSPNGPMFAGLHAEPAATDLEVELPALGPSVDGSTKTPLSFPRGDIPSDADQRLELISSKNQTTAGMTESTEHTSLQRSPAADTQGGGTESGEGESQGKSPEMAETLAQTENRTLGEEVLAGLDQNRMPTDASSAPSSSKRLSSLVNEVVDQVLVGEKGDLGKQEIRMTLKDSVLPNTEISVVRDGAALVVRFNTSSQDSAAWLQLNQQLVQRELTNNLQIQVSVELSGEQQDGRSRGQRDPYAEAEQDD